MIDPNTLPPVDTYGAPLYVVFVVLEMLLATWGVAKGRFETRDLLTSMSMGLGSVVFGLALRGIAAGGLFWLWQYRLVTLPVTIGVIALCFVLDDLRYYWTHRIGHRSRLYWADHVVHHSSRHYNLSTALRQPWFGGLFGLWALRAPLVLMGFHPGVIAFCGSLNLIYQFFIHTETVGRLPNWVEAVMNTPSHHRVHHARNPRYLDANYAGVFIIWDKMFGTFVPELDRDPPDYGLVSNIATFNPLRVATHEYVAIVQDQAQKLTLGQRLAYIFAPPGWSHDGSRADSRAIKRAFLAQYPDEAGTPGLPQTLLEDASTKSVSPA